MAQIFHFSKKSRIKAVGFRVTADFWWKGVQTAVRSRRGRGRELKLTRSADQTCICMFLTTKKRSAVQISWTLGSAKDLDRVIVPFEQQKICWSFGSTDHLAWPKDDQLNVWIDWSFGSTKRSANPFDWVILLCEVKKRADHWHQWIIWFNQTTRLDFWVDWTFGSTKPRPADHWNRLILFKQKRSKDFSTNRSDLLFQFELKKISKFSESTDVLTTHDLLIDHKPQRGSTDCLARPIASDRLISECWVEQKWIG